MTLFVQKGGSVTAHIYINIPDELLYICQNTINETSKLTDFL